MNEQLQHCHNKINLLENQVSDLKTRLETRNNALREIKAWFDYHGDFKSAFGGERIYRLLLDLTK